MLRDGCLVPGANRLSHGIGHLTRIIRLHADFNLSKARGERAIAEDALDPVGKIVAA